MAQEADSPSSGASRAQARLEAAMDEQKRSFLRMVSHELRTPLNSILGFSEILNSELYGPLGAPQYKEYAGIIHASGHKLLKLVNQVLEIARLEGRTIDFDAASEPLDTALDDVLPSLRPEMAARSVGIEIAGPLPCVMADHRGLRQVLTQLLQNAIAFSPEGSVIRASAQAQDGMVELSIRDEGEGVDPDEIPRLMAPFEQAETALTRKAEGAGLGLPIADLTCRAMGGRLRLVSAPGQGLTAVVRLPAG
ncbi:sensor histidine kinase KdpD [Phenylobacterium sp.]|uniref:sensor histidine kinase n=1 Tax=Phenylobacterium sp. TaxID=1871053 RepID=UPI0025FD2148|nr:HAMP domain-containing sensor histidine kinase [Phenylobacterium sp.]MBX3482433.1 HAMP domain-containing histidine kinase [Phenylobacterium sp.]